MKLIEKLSKETDKNFECLLSKDGNALYDSELSDVVVILIHKINELIDNHNNTIEVSINKNSIGENIKNLRIKNNLTQQDIADVLKISRASVSNIEKDRHRILVENLKGLCLLFKVESRSILGF